MLDRALTFADPEIVQMLQTGFIPVAIDQAYQRRQQDAEGEFYRKIAGQGPRNSFRGTTQGLYAAAPDGTFLFYNNNRGADRVRRLMKQALASYQPQDVAALETGKEDERYSPRPPTGGLVVRVRAKVLDGYQPTTDRWQQIFQSAISRDNLWISREEHKALAEHRFPLSLQHRIARFHLVDNTRGEPPMWKENEIRKLEMRIEEGQLRGRVELKTDDGSRGYEAELHGVLESNTDKITRFDCVALGQFWGEGTYTRGAPQGKFPLAISFSLADGSDVADAIAPQASRGWLRGYIR